MAVATTYAPLPAAEHSAQLRKAVIASTVGTAIEWYDFFLYGTAAGLIFGKLYFPNQEPLAATLAAFGTYFVGFAARPVGAAIFGHYGDRIGRKATLIATLMFMGISTFLVAFVPTYASIGIWGAVILTALRALQGIGVGGEWGGSVLLAMEWSRTHGQRGLVASWPQFGVPCGLLLSNLAVLAFSAWSGDQFVVWGWRIPFALSIILVGIGLWIRLGILETPVFQQLLDTNKIEKAPITEVIKKQPKEIILSALLRLSEQAPFYIFTAFIFAYAVGTLHMSRDLILSAVMVAACVSFISIPLSGHISDRIGRRRMYLIGVVVTGLFDSCISAWSIRRSRGRSSLPSCSRSFRTISSTGRRRRSSRNPSRRACATVAPRSVISWRRSSPAGRRRLSRPRCSPLITPATRSPFLSPPAPSSAR